jgi:hypothetical protein
MAKAFDTWTVLSHDPIEKYAENLWSVAGRMPDGKTQRRMTLIRLLDGRLVIHNGIALEDAAMAEVEAWGSPAFLLVPNGFHRQDARIYKQRYPSLRVLCPKNTSAKVAAIVTPDGSFDDGPEDERVRLFHLRGVKQREGAVLVRSDDGATLVFCDAVLNMKRLGGVMGFMLAPTGCVSVPRVMRWMVVSNARELRVHLEELAAEPGLCRLVFGHGATVTEGAAERLREAAARLG